MTRVYATVTGEDLVTMRSTGEYLPAAAFGVTPALSALLPEEDEEGHEHLATQFAAAAATADPVAVAVFTVPSVIATPDEGSATPGALRLSSPLRHRDLVCFLVADPGERVGDDADLELSWYDAGELAGVEALFGRSRG